MGLTLDPHRPATHGVVRCITERIGDPAVHGFIDKSELRLAERHDGVWKTGERLAIGRLDEIVGSIQPSGTVFLGPEDPDLFLTADGVLHLFFTIPFIRPDWSESYISLGHASGPDLMHLTAQAPVLTAKPTSHGARGFKEACIAPVNSAGQRYVLTESADKQEIWYSTMALATAPAGLDGAWTFQGDVVHPLHIKDRYVGFMLPGVTNSYDWCEEHVSPCRLLPKNFVDSGDLLVGIMNGRSRTVNNTFGKFLPGLFLFNPETGEVPWIDPLPLLDDISARNIVFASEFQLLPTGHGLLYAHLDDARIVAYEFSPKDIQSRLSRAQLVQ